MLVSLLMLALTLSLSPPEPEPQVGDNRVIVISEFENTREAIEHVVKHVLLPRRIVPLRCDVDMGYIVTERFYYWRAFNCDLVFSFRENDGHVVVEFFGRGYEVSANLLTIYHDILVKSKKDMKGSASSYYWDTVIPGIVEDIPNVGHGYYGHDDVIDKEAQRPTISF